MTAVTACQAAATTAITGGIIVHGDQVVTMVTGLCGQTGDGGIVLVPVGIPRGERITCSSFQGMAVLTLVRSCTVGILRLCIHTVQDTVTPITPNTMTVSTLGSIVVISGIAPLIGPSGSGRVTAGVTGQVCRIISRDNGRVDGRLRAKTTTVHMTAGG